jgi:hypothetical protein
MELHEIQDRLDVQDAVIRFGWYLDREDWSAMVDLLADQVTVDFTAVFGGQVETVAGPEQVRRWRELITAVDASQHVISGVLADIGGDEATATANVLVWLRRDAAPGSSLWHNGGTYEMRLTRTSTGWRITALTARSSWIEGNFAVLTPPGPQ